MLLWRDIQHNQEIISEIHRNTIRFFSCANTTITNKTAYYKCIIDLTFWKHSSRNCFILDQSINISIVKLLSKSQFLSKTPAISVKNNTRTALSSPAILPAHHGGILGSIDTIQIGAILATHKTCCFYSHKTRRDRRGYPGIHIYPPPAVKMTLGMQSEWLIFGTLWPYWFPGSGRWSALYLADILAACCC